MNSLPHTLDDSSTNKKLTDISGYFTEGGTRKELQSLLAEIVKLRQKAFKHGAKRLKRFKSVFPAIEFTTSSYNLAFYLGLRRHDIRPLQIRLASCGLSSFSHAEAHIQQAMDAVIHLLAKVLNQPVQLQTPFPSYSFKEGSTALARASERVFGLAPHNRTVRMMVTLPSEAATNYTLVKQLLEHGMDCARINCAHDTAKAWQKMVFNLRWAEHETKRPCKILMDLAGHKIRTRPTPLTASKPLVTPRVFRGDKLILDAQEHHNQPARYDENQVLQSPPIISCTSLAVFDFIKAGEQLWIDDGKIGATIDSIQGHQAHLSVTHAPLKGAKIKGDKGLNFPETALKLPSLSSKDLRDLDFVTKHADIVGFSFVQTTHDMQLLMAELAKRKVPNIPIIAKIETRKAVKNLPDILLCAAASHPLSVMIARGDLAVELGGERLAEIQEELLWLCEAAHVPVIWATQVLEGLTKKGKASRAEITDAAMSVRAECVMLNKGPYILDAVNMLVAILARMADHQTKKRPTARALHW